jgi:gluconate 2-dehydrogenase gamma chain
MDGSEGGPSLSRPRAESSQGATNEPEDARGGGLSRRDLLKRAGVVGVAAAVPAGVLAADAPAAPERELLTNFVASEAETLEAILDRLIPTDATGPGAREARVARYIDRALDGELSNFSNDYADGLAAVDAYAVKTYGRPFAGLQGAQQDAVLTAMERNTATGFTPDSRTFFTLIRTHALQGMFGDPYHGGNANFVGWDLIGFPGVYLEVPARDQQLDVVVRPNHKSTADFGILRVSRTRR